MALQSKLILLLPAFFFFAGCRGDIKNITTHQIIVLVDVTSDNPAMVPDAARISAALTKLVPQQADGISLSFGLLDDLSGASLEELSIAPSTGSTAMENPKKRQREVAEFHDKVKQMMAAKLSGAEIDKNYSKIFIKLCKSLNSLQSAPAERKVLVLYSDLLENSETTSFYKEDQLSEAVKDADSFYNNILKSKCALPDLSEVEIYLNVMREAKSDVRISKAEQFWTRLLESQGGVVKIDAI